MPQAKVRRKEILLQLGSMIEERDILVAALAGTTNECFHNLHRPGNLYLVGMGMVTPVSFGLAKALPSGGSSLLILIAVFFLHRTSFPWLGAYNPQIPSSS